MVSYGRKHCAYFEATDPKDALQATYYDAIRVFYQIADFTGDTSWNSCAARARKAYRDEYVIASQAWTVPGYWNFTTGLRMDWERTRDVRSKDTVIAMSQKAAYAMDVTPLANTANTITSREVAYAILSYLNAEALGERPALAATLTWSRHWATSTSGSSRRTAERRSPSWFQPRPGSITFSPSWWD